jgi:hypothetical protein
MCTYTHQFTKCNKCSDIIFEDKSCTVGCKLNKQGRACEKKTNNLATIYADPQDCAACSKAKK